MLTAEPYASAATYHDATERCSICAADPRYELADGEHQTQGLQAMADQPSRQVFVCRSCVELGQVCVHCKAIVGKDTEHFMRWVPGPDLRASAGRLFALCGPCSGAVPLATLLNWP